MKFINTAASRFRYGFTPFNHLHFLLDLSQQFLETRDPVKKIITVHGEPFCCDKDILDGNVHFAMITSN